MKLSIILDYSGEPRRSAAYAADLERAGVDVCWVAEAYSFDAVSMLGYLAAKTTTMELGTAIVPVFSRTPALLAMTAAGLDAVSDGRFILGIGASGPQVVEGWHAVPFDRPVTRQREIIEICRTVWRRDVVRYDGQAYQIPLPPERGTGLGKPLKLINHPVRSNIPIYVAALRDQNVAVTAEVADGWLPLFFHPERAMDVWGEPLARGLARRSPDLSPLEVVAGGVVAICEEDQATRLRDSARRMIALYVGGMGAREKNFYNTLFRRYGYEQEAETIQNLFLEGRKAEAEAAVPEEFLKATAMVGDEAWVKERIESYRAAGVTRLQIQPVGPEPLRVVERIKSWIS